ncbi:MAG: 50S ribosomal protein L30 [Bdellovibrionota bacterium]|jgi:ribosomal protein L30
MGHVLFVEQIKSSSKLTPKQKATLQSLGLKGRGSKIIRKDLRAIRGMLNHLQHLIVVDRIEEKDASSQLKAKGRKGTGLKIIGKGAA